MIFFILHFIYNLYQFYFYNNLYINDCYLKTKKKHFFLFYSCFYKINFFFYSIKLFQNFFFFIIVVVQKILSFKHNFYIQMFIQNYINFNIFYFKNNFLIFFKIFYLFIVLCILFVLWYLTWIEYLSIFKYKKYIHKSLKPLKKEKKNEVFE